MSLWHEFGFYSFQSLPCQFLMSPVLQFQTGVNDTNLGYIVQVWGTRWAPQVYVEKFTDFTLTIAADETITRGLSTLTDLPWFPFFCYPFIFLLLLSAFQSEFLPSFSLLQYPFIQSSFSPLSLFISYIPSCHFLPSPSLHLFSLSSLFLSVCLLLFTHPLPSLIFVYSMLYFLPFFSLPLHFISILALLPSFPFFLLSLFLSLQITFLLSLHPEPQSHPRHLYFVPSHLSAVGHVSLSLSLHCRPSFRPSFSQSLATSSFVARGQPFPSNM